MSPPHINQVALTGRLAEAPVFSISEWGVAHLSARLAVHRSQRNQDGQWEEEDCLFRVTIQAALAEHLAESLQKGTCVFVTGRLRSHVGPGDQEIVEVMARNLQLLTETGA